MHPGSSSKGDFRVSAHSHHRYWRRRGCDGQILVLQDLLGLNTGFEPKFVRHFAEGAQMVCRAIGAFDAAVKDGTFPSTKESYS